MTLNNKKLEFFSVVILTLITIVFFWDGDLDIGLASLFFDAGNIENNWPKQQFWLWGLLFDIAKPLLLICLLSALVLLIIGVFNEKVAKFRYRASYIILVIAIGPGLLVNLVLKDHWGRPRPRDIVEFNGQYKYVSPSVIAETGGKSFVCGHCSAAYMFFSFYFILNKGRSIVLCLTLCYSFLMGVTRMSAGGHFVSDILLSGSVVFFTCWFLYYYIFREFKQKVIKFPNKA